MLRTFGAASSPEPVSAGCGALGNASRDLTRPDLILEARIKNLSPGTVNVIRHSAQFDGRFIHVVNDICRFGIIVTRLTDGTRIHEVLFAALDSETRVGAASDDAIAGERDWNMCVAKKTKPSLLMSQAGSCRQSVEHVLPPLRGVETGVNNREVFDSSRVGQPVQPLTVVVGELVAGPLHDLGGARLEIIKGQIRSAVFIVIAFNARSIHAAHNIDASLRVGIISNEVSKKGKMRAALFLCISQHR